MKFKFISLIFFLFINTNGSQAQCLLDKSNFDLYWNDEFNYPNNNLNLLLNKWLPHYAWQTPANARINEHACDRYLWETNNLSLHKNIFGEGFLTIRAKRLIPEPIIDNVAYPYSSGMILAKFDECAGGWEPFGFNYGMFEIKCKLPPPGAGLSSFWLIGNGYEIDLFEASKNNGDNKWTFFSTVQAALVENGTFCSTYYDWLFSDPSEAFHTYTLVWIKDKVTFFIDGMEIRTSTLKPQSDNNCYRQKMSLVASVHPHCNNSYNYNNTGTMAGGMVIDYIRVYKPKQFPGMPLPVGYQFPSYKSSETFNNINVSKMLNQDIDNYALTAGYTQLNISLNERLIYAKANGNISYFQHHALIPNSWSHYNTSINNVGTGSTMVSDIEGSKIFYRGKDNEIWVYGYWNNNSIEGIASSLDNNNVYANNVSLSSPLVFVNSPTPRLYFKNSSNQLCYYEFKASTTPQWQKHTTSITISSNEIVSNSQSNGIFYKGNDNEIWTYYVDNGNTVHISMDMYNLYPNDVSRGIAANGNRIYYINNSNSVSYFEYVNSTSHWQKFSTPTNEVSSSIVPRNNNQGFFYISNDGDVYSYHYYQGSWVFNKVNFLLSDKQSFNLLKKGLFNENRLYYIDINKRLRFWEWGNCEVLNPMCNTPTNGSQLGLKGIGNDTVENNDKLKEGMPKSTHKLYADSNSTTQFRIYPNPFNSVIRIDVPKSYKGKKMIIFFYNTLGSECLRANFDDNEEVNTSMLGNGSYFYIIRINQTLEQVAKGIIIK